MSVHILCPFLNELVCFFPVNLFEFFVNSGYQPFVRWVNCKNFFPFCWLLIHSSDCFFCRAEALEFDHISVFYCILGFGVHVKNMQHCCIGTHMAVWFAAFPPSPISGISPHAISPQLPSTHCPSPISPQQTPVCDAPLPVSMCSHCSTPTYGWERGVWFSVLVSVCWEWWFPDSSVSLQRTWTHHFWWLHNIPWCICATFFQSSLLSMGIWVDSRSLLL